MKLDLNKLNICLARNKMSKSSLAEEYGVSRARMNVLLNQREVTNVVAGRIAETLKCDVTEIIE